MSKRYMGIDYGEKRIGIAFSDPLNLTAQAHSYIENNLETIESMKNLIFDYNVDKIVLGLPKNREGKDSVKAQEVREFAKKLQEELGIEIVFWDERYSTVAVTKHLIKADISRKKRKKIIDSQAAAFILQGYLDSLS